MTENAQSLLGAWSNFYVMTGSSAAALTGLMFVVLTLITGSERVRRSHDGIATFSTPTVLYFAAIMLLSANFLAPWHWIWHAAVVAGAIGLYGVGHILKVMFMTRRLQTYTPDLEDWTWFSILPFVSYAAIVAGAILLFSNPRTALFVVAGGIVLLLLIGIRNSWDVVTFIVMDDSQEPPA